MLLFLRKRLLTQIGAGHEIIFISSITEYALCDNFFNEHGSAAAEKRIFKIYRR